MTIWVSAERMIAGTKVVQRPVVLASMPWTITRAPSIQLGILKALLEREGLPTLTCHLYVSFFDHISSRLQGKRVSVDTFDSFGELVGDWVFAVPPLREIRPDDDRAWRDIVLAQKDQQWVEAALRTRELVPEFLDRSADEILAHAPRVVGFSTTFQQNVASLVLAKLLKQRRPDLRIVFGGANCEGPMGEAMHRLFPWIDVVVRGEAEAIAPRLFCELVEGAPVTRMPGLCVRNSDGSGVFIVPEEASEPGSASDRLTTLSKNPRTKAASGPVAMDDVPLPIYDDFFAQLENSALAKHLDQKWLPYESARGCWWALKHVCTFCAANAQFLTFRSKQPGQVHTEVLELSKRHQTPHVWFVDNIMEERYLRELFPKMRDDAHKVQLFVETRAHVTREQMRAMHEAGVIMVQLGLESFSSPILQLMEKGTTAIQNVRVLKWAAELGIQAFYNLIYGFPGEDPAEYDRMADAIPSLSHLEPPNMPVRLRLDRFSPYFRDPERHGIEITGPRPSRKFLYNLDDVDLSQLEYFFTFRYKDGRDPDSYVGRFVDACTQWTRDWRRNARALTYHPQPDGSAVIVERRTNAQPARFQLDALANRVYFRCDAGSTPAQLWSAMDDNEKSGRSINDLTAFLDQLVHSRLMFRERGKYLSLALSLGNEVPATAVGLTEITVRLPQSGRCTS